jgi:hypothetical protein
MQTKTNVLVFSLVAILTLSIATMGGIPQAIADKDKEDDKHDDKDKSSFDFKKFPTKPHFETADCRVASSDVASTVAAQLGITVNPDGTLDGADCSAKAWFNGKTNALKYKIQINGMDLVDIDGDISNDIGKMHFHQAAGFMMNNPENPMGPQHVLNIFRAPAMDDGNLVVKPIQKILKGIWDDSDAVDRDGDNDDTFEITDKDIQESLCQGEVFLMVHGQIEKDDGSIDKPGFIKAALQPTNAGEKLCEKKLKLSTDSDLLS